MPGTSLSRTRVLVVEDEMMVSMLLEDMLSDIGCIPVGPATRIGAALQFVENAGFDIAILDVNLYGEETYAVADALKARAMPFIFASGYSPERMRDEYRNVPSLQKPFQQQDLEWTLVAALERARPPQSAS